MQATMAGAASCSTCVLLVLLLASLQVEVASGLAFDRNNFVSDVKKWQVHVLMVVSMSVQLLLLATGGLRKRSSFLRLVAWIAYTSSDAVAVYTLGLMISDTRRTDYHTNIAFSLWGPILLLHLGAPDNITAYSNADTELWPRHALTLLLQLGFVLYLVGCLGSGPYLTVAIFLLVAGLNKYAERTLALYYGSKAAVVSAVYPIYKFMGLEAGLGEDYHYIVMGEADWYQTMDALAAKNGGRFILKDSVEKSAGLVRFHELEEVCDEAFPGKQQPVYHNLKKVSDEALKEHLLNLCLAHALFKMLRRRLTALFMYEKQREKTRKLYTDHLKDPERIVRVLDMELRFLFDSIYTKAGGTAFTILGLCCRLLNLVLLLVSCLFLVTIVEPYGLSSRYSASWAITVTLVAGALGIEVYQLLRIVLSDWTHVRVACAYVKARRRGSSMAGSPRCWDPVVRTICFAFLHVRYRMGSLRPDYWSHSFRLHSMLHDPRKQHERSVFDRCLGTSAYRFMREALGKLLDNRAMILLDLIPVTCLPQLHTTRLKRQLMRKVLARLESPSRHLAEVLSVTLRREENQAFLFASNTDLEHAILHWHIASSICEWENERVTAGSSHSNDMSDDMSDFEVSRYVSRYVMYLLVAKTELLPCHPNIGRLIYHQTLGELDRRWPNHRDILNETRNPGSVGSTSVVDQGIELGHQLREAGGRCWNVLADVWCDFVITIAMADRPYEHLEQLTVGGEFVTHIWVLLNQSV